MNEQCKFCIHNDVCAYKEHYKDAVELYKKAYPYFVCDIRCVKYLKKIAPNESRLTGSASPTGAESEVQDADSN